MDDKDYGYITISRRLFEGPLWNEERQKSLVEAWLWLIKEARFEIAPKKELVGGKMVTWSRGQLPGSVRFLATQWQWSNGKVMRFLEMLETEEMIKRHIDPNSGQSIISLTNYEKYNSKRNTKKNTDGHTIIKDGIELHNKGDTPTDTPNGTTTEHRRNDTNKDNTGKEKGDGVAAPTPDEVAFRKFQDWINAHAPNVAKLKEPFTLKDFLKIRNKYPSEVVRELLKAMHNWKPLLVKNVSAYYTLDRWQKKDEKQKPKNEPGNKAVEKIQQDINRAANNAPGQNPTPGPGD